MRVILFIFFLILLSNCSKPKTVLICGDHVCINKAEANQFFEENLTIEVKILDKKAKKEIDLVELNLNKDNSANRRVIISSKNKTDKKLKSLTKEEINEIKENIKNKNNEKKIVKKVISNSKNDLDKKKELIDKYEKAKQSNVNKIRKNTVDVCTILKKCSIDEISKYLLKQGKKKIFQI